MKVKIRDITYDSNLEPILLILSDEDKFNITHMEPKAYYYCSYPSGTDPDAIRKWMEEANSH